MSLLTQCPACKTLFRVVQDQLRVSQGWVRCGQCSEVFQGNLYLQQTSHVGPSAVAAGAATPLAPREPAAVEAASIPTGAAAVVEVSLQEGVPEPAPSSIADATTGAVQGAPPTADARGFAVEAAILPPGGLDDHLDTQKLATSGGQSEADASAPGATTAQGPEDAGEREGAFALAADSSGRDAAAQAQDETEGGSSLAAVAPGADAGGATGVAAAEIGFLQAALPRPRTHWTLRVLLGLSVVGLLAGLLWQVAVFERNRISAVQPLLKPAMVELCALSACELGPLQQIESLSIETSAFNAVKPGYYRLSVTVRNAAALELAMPAIELVLHDSQDEVLLRRVLTPNEFGVSAQQIAASSEANGAVMVALNADVLPPGKRVAGYRLTAFYP